MSANDPNRTLSFAPNCRDFWLPLWLSETNAVAWEDIMNLMHVFVASTAAFLILGSGAAKAGQTINDVGAIACVNDKRDVKEPKKGHKLATTLADA
jgi:hypothetical protein